MFYIDVVNIFEGVLPSHIKNQQWTQFDRIYDNQ